MSVRSVGRHLRRELIAPEASEAILLTAGPCGRGPFEGDTMRFGAHLPLMDFGGHPYTLAHLASYARRAADLGFGMLAANDHLVFASAWLDGPTALASVIGDSGSMTLATTVSLPVIRGPVQLAKAMAAVDRLSGGRAVVAVGAGSSPRDFEIAGIDFEERWKRLDESVRTLRALWQADREPFVGRFYSTEGIELLPRPAQPGGPPIWIGSWGSDAGLRRTARLGDGWLASAYNTTPPEFAVAWDRLRGLLAAERKDAESFPNALGTMWFHITDDADEADQVFRQRLAPVIHRPEETLRERLPVGPAPAFAEKLGAFRDAGVQQVLLWPVADEERQLELFCESVLPLVAPSR
jgi:alkanesulfonate monooxygenase SsuD/methylene tetrahydromethanopterin reductase-like flavin-dependent oxidoreductase (luciferase family)